MRKTGMRVSRKNGEMEVRVGLADGSWRWEVKGPHRKAQIRERTLGVRPWGSRGLGDVPETPKPVLWHLGATYRARCG